MNRWQSQDFLLVRATQTFAVMLNEFEHCVPRFVISQGAGQVVSAVLSGLEFLLRYDRLRASRFPGDLDPAHLTLEDVIGPGEAFTQMAMRSVGHVRRQSPLPEGHILLMDKALVLAVVSAEDVQGWLESLRPRNLTSNVIRLKEP